MKYCSKCGNELFDEAVICPKCGCPTESPKAQAKEKKQINANTLKGTLLIVAGILVIIVTVLAVLSQM